MSIHSQRTCLMALHSMRMRTFSSNPTWFDRHFGIEIELILPQQHMIQNRNDLHYYLHSIRDMHNQQNMLFNEWVIKKDITIHIDEENNDLFGFEIISPKLLYGNQSKQQIHQICSILSNYPLNAYLNVSCGFHVHCDAQYIDLEQIHQIAQNYNFFELVIDEYMNSSRRANNNEHAKSLNFLTQQKGKDYIPKSSKAMDIYLNPNGKRYKLNFCALKSHLRLNTIENRHHMATIDPLEMLNWIKFNLLFIHQSIALDMETSKVFDVETKEIMLWDFMNDADLQRYFQQRTVIDDLLSLQELNKMNALSTKKLTSVQKVKLLISDIGAMLNEFLLRSKMI